MSKEIKNKETEEEREERLDRLERKIYLCCAIGLLVFVIFAMIYRGYGFDVILITIIGNLVIASLVILFVSLASLM